MNKDLKEFEEILQNLYQHIAVIVETNLVDGLTPTKIIAQLANELVLLEESGDIETYKKKYIDPHMNEEQMEAALADIEGQLSEKITTKKNSMH